MTKQGRPQHPDILTPAEWRVVEGVRHGLTNPAIAERCDLSLDAVKFHVSNALSKLDMQSRRELRQWTGVRADSALSTANPKRQSDSWSLGQIAIAARNFTQMAEWLRDIVGLREVMRFENMAFFDCGGIRLYLSPGDPAGNSLLYFRVKELHSEVDRLRSSGVEIVSAPHRIHVHEDGTEEWMAFFADPEGGRIGMMSSTAKGDGENS